MIYRVEHTTIYEYPEPVSLGHHLVHLVCRATPTQALRRGELLVEPVPTAAAVRVDAFGNPVHFFALQEPHAQLTITATNRVEVRPEPPPARDQTPPWEQVVARLASDRAPEVLDALQYTFESRYVPLLPELIEYARPAFPPGRPVLAGLLELLGRIHADFRYDAGATTLATPVEGVLRGRRGVCQDFAHLMIGCLRGLGLAARYVSGYLRTLPPPGRPRLVGADASHAWLAAWCPGSGWVDLDPTNNVVPAADHITLAWGRDYDDVSPIKGILLGGGPHTVAVAVDVEPE